MRYIERASFEGTGIQELSLDEITFVSGGESPSYSLTGRGPELTTPSATQVANAATAASVGADAVAYSSRNPVVKAGAVAASIVLSGVSAVATIVAGSGPDDPKNNKKHVKKQ